MVKGVLGELREHSPFTFFGAFTGSALMLLFKDVSHETAHKLFYLFHPLHIALSAVATAALYRKYLSNQAPGIKRFLKVFAVGLTGAIGIGTLSDSLIPFWGQSLLGVEQKPFCLGFVDKWWLINPLAVIAIIFAYKRPKTKFSHAGHVLVSTWASLFYMLMTASSGQDLPYFGIFIFLFLAVLLPCCLSDIVFPLLFLRRQKSSSR